VPWGTLSDLEIQRKRGEAAVGEKKQGKDRKNKNKKKIIMLQDARIKYRRKRIRRQHDSRPASTL